MVGPHLDELLRSRVWKWTQKNRTQHAEDRRVRANAKREGQERDEGERRRASQHASADGEILAHFTPPVAASLRDHRLFPNPGQFTGDGVAVAECLERRTPSVFAAHARGLELSRSQFDVHLDLALDIT